MKFHKILNNIKLASQIKRDFIKMRINKNDMKLIKLLISFRFINYIRKPVDKITQTHDNYYYISINTKNKLRLKNLFRPSGVRTITYKELSNNALLKKNQYVLSTNIGLTPQNVAIKYKLSGILLMVMYV